MKQDQMATIFEIQKSLEINSKSILIACEESQTITNIFRQKGFNCFSCDLKPGRINDEWHYEGDIYDIINLKWSMMIAHPPCTYLCLTGNNWFNYKEKRTSGALVGDERKKAKEDSIKFFINLYNAEIPKIAIENPVGCMSSIFKKPDQIVHPYYFGDPTTKKTCLWLKGLPKLNHTKKDNLFEKSTYVDPEFVLAKTGKRYPKWFMYESADKHPVGEKRREFRSKTFEGIANAMVEQWGCQLL